MWAHVHDACAQHTHTHTFIQREGINVLLHPHTAYSYITNTLPPHIHIQPPATSPAPYPPTYTHSLQLHHQHPTPPHTHTAYRYITSTLPPHIHNIYLYPPDPASAPLPTLNPKTLYPPARSPHLPLRAPHSPPPRAPHCVRGPCQHHVVSE